MKHFHFLNLFLTSLCLLFFSPVNTSALNYTITFTGSGASTTVESVIVQNLTKGTTVTVPGGNALNLTDVATSVDDLSVNADCISISPNPIKENALVSFYASHAGMTQISAYSLDGRKIMGVDANLLQGKNSFCLSIPKGIYLLKVNGNGYSYNAKAISKNVANIIPNITMNSVSSVSRIQKSKSAVTTMLYSSGDQLLYKGKSGNYTTIVTDVPNATKTTNFEFVECKDGDGNYYAVVKIGTQTWMAENLRTTKFNDLSDIAYSSDLNSRSSAYCWYNNLSINSTNKTLYNWYSINTSKLAPIGWHVPTDSDWEILRTLYGGYFDAGGKLMESGNAHWLTPNTIATNESGFSALPSGRLMLQDIFDGEQLTHFWSSTYYGVYSSTGRQSSRAYVLSPNSNLFADYIYSIYCMFSIRCIKD